MKQYISYTDSHINWITKIPSHWKLNYLKYAAPLKSSKVEISSDSDIHYPYVGLEHIQPWTGKLLPIDRDFQPEGVSNLFNKDNVLFGKLRPYLAKATKPDFDGICSSELLVLNGIDTVPDFLRYVILTDGFIDNVNSSTYGAKMPRASWNFIGKMKIPVPPKNEQKEIVSFLDRKTHEIDSLIETKQVFIKKLQEKRIALISKTVTRGLDNSSKMKESGVDWIGKYPQDWSHVKLKWKSKIYSGGTPSTDHPEYWENGQIPWLASGEVNKKNIYSADNFITEEGVKSSSAKWVPAKSVLMALAGQGKTKATVACLEIKATCNQSLAAIIPSKDLNHKYLFYYLDSKYKQIRGLVGNSRDGLNLNHIGNIFIPLPSTTEQELIVGYLDKELSLIDELTSKVDTAIKMLQEYRISLITIAVTGKVKVIGDIDE